MGRNGVAGILAFFYVALAISVVHAVGQAHRDALVDGRTSNSQTAENKDRDPKPDLGPLNLDKPAEAPKPAVAEVPEVKPAPGSDTKTAPAIADIRQPSTTPTPAPVPAPSAPVMPKNAEPNTASSAAAANTKPSALANEPADSVWKRPEMTKVWDLKKITPEEEMRLGSQIHSAILELKGAATVSSYLRRLEEAADPLLKFRQRKDIPLKFEVLEGNEWNAFSHPGDYIYVSRGLIDAVGTDDDELYVLQFAIAHELFHLDNRIALLAMNDPSILDQSGGTIQKFLTVILPNAYPDKPEFDADRWAYQNLLRLGDTPPECLGFLVRLENYAKLPRNNFEGGRTPWRFVEGYLPFDNHIAAHPAPWKRKKTLKDSVAPGSKPASAPTPAK